MGARWHYSTKWGTFWIIQKEGRFDVILSDESLGSYASPDLALCDLLGGHTYSPSNGLDTSNAGLPEDLTEWAFEEG